MMARRPPRGWRLEPRTQLLVPTLLRMGAAGASQGGGGTYATWNPSDKHADVTLSNGNRTLSASAFGYRGARATVGKASGKWYYESKLLNTPSNKFGCGIANTSEFLGNYPGATANSHGWRSSAYLFPGATSYGTAASINDVVMIAVDLDSGEIYFGRQGTWFGSSDPATNTNPAATVAADTWYPFCGNNGNGSSFSQTANFDPADFAYSAPSGYSAWAA